MDFTTGDLKALFGAFAERMATERDRLCALDGVIGDADHGIAMEQGMKAAAEAAQAAEGTLQDIFNAAAKGFLNAIGASSGPLYATALLRAGKAAGPRASMPTGELRTIIAAMRDGIAQRGKAEPGQKTMLDAWGPAADAAVNGHNADAIAAAARRGTEATRDMIATVGRAARLGERSLGHADPGSVSAAMLVEEICKAMKIA
ncbi:dihydroxyacetone kinase subunit L [Mesorhizobium sp. M1A.F.Ca.IN.020.06.1.1]|uniref:dihydroxyacetone kinase subunit DhaL n=3 Tax=Mesorhizobium TaxID=68287 RepID=UPI000BAEC4EF|nr:MULTISPECIES: dihydroxyacetone kinase subunit DhaL [unclassified Mesorhizobium]PBB29474.1 dihydroxyacetone kinase subunit L [Mesorhizobium sp. WSM3882]RUV06550.1 dihydroxyacetone kinase subunit L [Mesorhizobium sp. M1A.F.Ca.IN.020.03.2.1]RUV88277.1 dihydroxyacetone kinase subunit L [Mesorhizobium sp. M1A.F.Ca.IN.020.32.1.1]RUW20106.1 dihydroxyacetone kinase subunit L [Mesorhizobium sp. M1A.F.Ca.IN.020.06.1.1]RWF83396.1 MAG: dihydroxyacetone kinase subunit L [Mesorhizobium sp.]